MNLLALFHRIQAGDEHAFAELIRSESGVLTALVTVGLPSYARDRVPGCVQEVWVRFWQRRHVLQFSGVGPLRKWLFEVVRYVIHEELSALAMIGQRSTPNPSSPTPSVEELHESGREADAAGTLDDCVTVRHEIYRLPRDDQIILFLRFYLRWEHDEIVVSRLLPLRDGDQSRSRLFQARQRLKLALRSRSPQLAERLFGSEEDGDEPAASEPTN